MITPSYTTLGRSFIDDLGDKFRVRARNGLQC